VQIYPKTLAIKNEVPGYFSREDIITGSVIRIVMMLVAATGN